MLILVFSQQCMLCKEGGHNEKLGVYIHNGMEIIQFKHVLECYSFRFSL